MSVNNFKDVPAEELSMVEVAKGILEDNNQTEIKFTDLLAQVTSVVGKSADADEQMAQFYTDLNADGSFISLGDNKWALRAWYPIDSIDESIHEIEDYDEDPSSPVVKKKTAPKALIAAEDDDVIDYNDDDPEDQDLDVVAVDGDEESPVDEKELVEVIDDDDDDIDIDDDVANDMNLTEVDEDDLDDSEDQADE